MHAPSLRYLISILLAVGCTAFFAGTVSAQTGTPQEQQKKEDETQDPDGLGKLTLEELMDMEITSAAKKSQKLSDVMGAVSVLTAEDIRRSGMRTLPDLLRTIPGMQVARIDGSIFSVAARGFGGQFANKLLVLIDGRTVYSPLYSGVYWNTRDVALEEVERIEVVRGPGGSLWGANAVNGVINIITKKAEDSQGTMSYLGGGDEERVLAGGRIGFMLDDKTSARIYGKFFDRDGQVDSNGNATPDEWTQLRTGFRADREIDDRTTLTLSGDYFKGHADSMNDTLIVGAPYTRRDIDRHYSEGGNFLARWQHAGENGVESTYQFWYDHVEFASPFLSQHRSTFDLEGQWRMPLFEDHELMTGLGYRNLKQSVSAGRNVDFDKRNERDQIFQAFVRGEFKLSDTWTGAVGVKLSHNDYTGFEFQPDVRLRWRKSDGETVWLAHSQAVRTPSRVENDINATVTSGPGPFGLTLQSQLIGNRDAESEEVRATELGYRIQVNEDLSFDVAAFYNEYDELLVLKAVGTPTVAPPRVIQNLMYDNDGHAESFGVEIAGQWRVNDNLVVHGNYSWMRVDVHANPASFVTTATSDETSHPQNTAHLRLNYNASEAVELDTMLFYVDRISYYSVDSYLRWDARIGFQVSEETNASLVIQNILDSHHAEYGAQFTQQASEVERAYYFLMTTRF